MGTKGKARIQPQEGTEEHERPPKSGFGSINYYKVTIAVALGVLFAQCVSLLIQVNVDVFRPHLKVAFTALLLSLPLRSWKRSQMEGLQTSDGEQGVLRMIRAQIGEAIKNTCALRLRTLSSLLQKILVCYASAVILSLSIGCSRTVASVVMVPLVLVRDLIVLLLSQSSLFRKFFSRHKTMFLTIKLLGVSFAFCIIVFLVILNLGQELPRIASSTGAVLHSSLISVGIEHETLAYAGAAVASNISAAAWGWLSHLDQTIIQDPQLRHHISPAFDALRMATSADEHYCLEHAEQLGLMRSNSTAGEQVWCERFLHLYCNSSEFHSENSSISQNDNICIEDDVTEGMNSPSPEPFVLSVVSRSQLLYGAYVLSGQSSFVDEKRCVHVYNQSEENADRETGTNGYSVLPASATLREYIFPKDARITEAFSSFNWNETWEKLKKGYQVASEISIGGWKLEHGLKASASVMRTLLLLCFEILRFLWYLLTEYGATVIVFLSTLQHFVLMERSPLDSIVDYLPVPEKRRCAVRDTLHVQVATSLLLPIRLGIVHAFGTIFLFSLFGIPCPFVAGILAGIIPFVPSIDSTAVLFPWVIVLFLTEEYISFAVVLALLILRTLYLDDVLQEAFYEQTVSEQTGRTQNVGPKESTPLLYKSYAPPELMSVIVGLGFYEFGLKGLVLGPLLVSAVFVLGELLQGIHEHDNGNDETEIPGETSSNRNRT
eukprot:gb/GECG01002150.1/.p1 GENE.gb/GECG01002150.1/~~gb/GECG01002150.1/.p1  ORF type:complete len:719 (+),score=50.92 gb/GECG01002150.1/:1-2157(+)